MASSRLLLFFPLLVLAATAAVGDKEHAEHGSRSKSASFHDEHYKDGEHHEDMDHEAIIGSKKGAEEYDQLSPEESKRRLRILAGQMDANGDGFISKEELNAWITKSMRSLDEEETSERFNEIDDNKDGELTWDEYRKDAFGDDDGEHEDKDPEDKKLFEEDKLYFTAADGDHNGKLSRDEFASFQNPEHHEHMHTTLVELTLKEKDADKDGLISFAEYIGELNQDEEGEWYKVEKSRFETDYDKDGDGKLNKDEMKAWLVPDIATTAQEETDHLFKETDKDNDDKLSIDEVVEQHQLFVGSEATNYGDHLEKVEL